MNKLAKLIANGEITVDELANAHELIERAQLVLKGLNACKSTIMFPLGITEVNCYSYTDFAGEYASWGTCNKDGLFTCFSNWGGNHVIGQCNLTNFTEVFMAFENAEFKHDLGRFLLQQIEKANC